MRVAPSVRATSMSGACAVTTICSDAVVCCIFTGTVSVCPTPRSRFFTTAGAKPSSVARTSYGPSGKRMPRKRPAAQRDQLSRAAEADAGGELRQIEKVAPVVRQSAHRLLIDARRPFRARHFDERRLRGDDDLLGRRRLLHLHRHRQRLSDAEVEVLHDGGGEAFERCPHFVRSERQEDAAKAACRVSDDRLHVVRGVVVNRHGDAGKKTSLRIDDGALDDTGGRLRLCECAEGEKGVEENEVESPTHGASYSCGGLDVEVRYHTRAAHPGSHPVEDRRLACPFSFGKDRQARAPILHWTTPYVSNCVFRFTP